ncbi:nitrate- and nitrite sensing domain-containing protein [Streptomyces sp. NPDC051211]|uniref:nitrate- and nitrite sensing domain-containing protein n=1 Tax=Streptomyces sp. NPDC051211 TaxID=3154643 RepID=UPI0034502A0F
MRRRLVISVAVAGLAVLAAGAPAVLSATADLNDSQELVTRADQARHTLSLAHALADERDAVTEFVAKGRPGAGKAAVQERSGRVDRQTAEVQAEADEELARALGRVEAVRGEAVDGKGSALAAHQAYSAVIAELLAPGARLAELTPPRATPALATTRPLAPLGLAVDQASATRGLLLAALAVPRGEQPSSALPSPLEDSLATAAQRARVREQGALDDFARAARPDVRETLAATVTGPEVKAADDFLGRLTDRPTLSPADRKLDGETVGAALSARIDRMRSVESTLAAERATAMAGLRDDDVTALEMLIALLGVLFLVAVGVMTAVARSLTRPLSVLRRGAARLATAEGSVEPVRFTGRNDEFADVVRSLNAVRQMTVSLHTRIAGLDADRRRLIGRNEALTAGRTELEDELADLRAGLEEHRRIMSTTSVSLSLRTLGLVERQLSVIEELESKEQDPDRLATLFKLDHLATVMRRHNENLLVLAGQEHGHGQAGPVPLVDVMRAAVSEIERYERVDLQALPAYTQVAGHAADDISHVLAELLENATTFSPPEAKVKVSGWLLDSGDAVLSVVDEGIGITEDRLALLNERLSTPDAYEAEPEAEHGLGLGLYVAGRLAAQHGVEAELRASRNGGTEALVVIPAPLLPAGPPATPVHALGVPGAPFLHLPGVVAEANENTLPPRLRPPRPATDAAPAEPDADPTALAGPAATPAEPDADPAAATEPDTLAGPAAEPQPEPDAAAEFPPAGQPPAEQLFPAAPEPVSAPEHASAPDTFPEPGPAARPGEPEPGLPPAEQLFTAEPEPAAPAEPGPDAEPLSDAGRPDAGLPPAEQVFTAAAEHAAPAEPGSDGEPSAHAGRPDAGLPPAEQVFTAAAEHAAPAEPAPDAGPVARSGGSGVGLPPVSQVFTVPAPEVELPPQGQVFTVPAPEAPPTGEAFAAAPATPEAPPTGQVFTVPAPAPAPAPEADSHGLAPDEAPAVTDKGLPKRTPRVVAAGRPEPKPEPKRVDAEELRRRLGGFYQGARDGRRVVAAELAEGHTDQGDTAQEART